MIKLLLKFILIIIVLTVAAYVAFAYSQGGFHKKEPVVLSVKNYSGSFLFAHRGVVGKFPENSMEAIELARKTGFKAVEIDIRKTSDGKFILFHDADADRLLGIDTTIASLSFNEIMQYKLLMNGDTTKSKVVALEDVINTFRDDFIYYFDMKLGNFNDVDELIHLIWSHDISKQVILASPSFLVPLYIEYNYPAIQTAMEGFGSGNEWSWSLIPMKLKPDFLSGTAKKTDEKHILWLKKHDLLDSRIVYGVDSSNYRRITDLGINKMIIDYWPGLILN